MFETLISYDIVPFIIALSVLVFIHEYGHYIVAKMNGVAVDAFSIGFGPELFGWNDKSGTRWKVAALPLGGYVKMRGDTNAASAPIGEADLTEEEKAIAFPYKRLGQRAAIVAAGPIFNFLFAIILIAGIYMTAGQSYIQPVIDHIVEDSAAEAAGFKIDDRIVKMNGTKIYRFKDIKRQVGLNTGTPINIVFERDGQQMTKTVTPKAKMIEGDKLVKSVMLLGISAEQEEFNKLGPMEAVGAAIRETGMMVVDIFRALGQIIRGERSFKELGGPVKIAQISGSVADAGVEQKTWVPFLMLMAMLSVNLGLINLFPIPALDGGHLLFYAYEAVFRKPMSPKMQEIGATAGVGLILTLIVVITWNDMVALFMS